MNGHGQHAQPSAAPVKVIVVGAGFAGLTAAIECQRKGQAVVVYEKIKDIKPLGDISEQRARERQPVKRN